MASLKELIADNEDWLVARVLAYAKRHGYTTYSSTLEEPWRESICGFSRPLMVALGQSEQPFDLSARTDYRHEPITRFAVDEARLHRERGIPVAMFLGLTKYYRQAYFDLLMRDGGAGEEVERQRLFIERFFDHVEIAFCSEWMAADGAEQIVEAHTKNRQLTNEKNKYLTIFESLIEPVILLDDRNRVENLNYAAAALFDEAAVPGQGYYGNGSYPMLQSQLEVLLGGSDASGSFECRLETTSGSREFHVKRQRSLDVSEKFSGQVLILSDITEYKRARQLADAASRAKSAFLATMSHEIRTPINSILGIGRLLHDGPLSETQAEYVAGLVSSGEVLLALINDVLDYSKIEAEAVEVESAAFDPRDMLEQLVGIVAASADEKGLEIHTRIDERLPRRVLGDHAKVRRILLNLITNAVKFTTDGSVKLSVEVNEEAIRYAVEDTGPGVPEEVQRSLFNPFIQTAASPGGHERGTGLGLAISKRLAELIDGDLQFESRIGEGSRFWLDTPLVAATADDAVESAAAELPALPRLRVLLVEDDEINRLVTEGFLAKDSHQMQVVESGEAALAAVVAAPFDIVLMDVRMRGIGGLEAIRQLRALDTSDKAGLAILVLTADVENTQERTCMEYGADGVLEKPFNPTQLKMAIKACLARAEQRRAAADQGGAADVLLDRSVLAQHRQELGLERARLIFETFQTSAPTTMSAIQNAVESQDLVKLSDLAHSLKSAAGNLGLLRLMESARVLERTAKSPEPNAVSAAVEGLQSEFDRSVLALRAAEVEALLQD